MAKKHRKGRGRLWFRPLKPEEIRKEKIRVLESMCEWCEKKKSSKELDLHHIDWGGPEPSYVKIRVPIGDTLFLRKEHRAGYDPLALRLVCRKCHDEIHKQPELAEARGFKRKNLKNKKSKKRGGVKRWVGVGLMEKNVSSIIKINLGS